MSSSTITPQRAQYLRQRLSSLMEIREFRAVFRRVHVLERAKEDLLETTRLQAKQLVLSEIHVSKLKEKIESAEAKAEALEESGRLVERLKELQDDQRFKADKLEDEVLGLQDEITDAERWAHDLLREKEEVEDQVDELERLVAEKEAEKARAESRVADLEALLEEKGIEVPEPEEW